MSFNSMDLVCLLWIDGCLYALSMLEDGFVYVLNYVDDIILAGRKRAVVVHARKNSGVKITSIKCCCF